ncbi:MAG: hypothetical protein GY719_29760 [bacterium]|nr:hypothetical protein [bacterium]
MSTQHDVSDLPILRTKLYRPPVAADLVPRDRLVARLEEGSARPLTLVSAPAGYGKSTLVSHWLATSETPSAWISLDATENETRAFLEYFIAAVRGLFPEACADLRALLGAGDLPAPAAVAGRLVNDLDRVATDAIAGRFVLALDDYHTVTDLGVQEIVDFVINQAPRSLHLVIVARRDPLLSLVRFRARQLMTEIRLPDLRFTAAESAALFAAARGETPEEADIERLHLATEGWPVAVRLAAGALDRHTELDGLVAGVRGDLRHTQEFLLVEILRHQPPPMRDWLRRTAILDRFCAPLVEAVCADPTEGDLNGESFLDRLEHSGLPTVTLDEGGDWHRYHHLVGDLLRHELERGLDANALADLSTRAAEWFEGAGLLEEALRHLVAAGEDQAAAALMLRHRGALLDGERWHRLDRLLSLLPRAVADDDPELLLLAAWSLEHRGRYGDFIRLAERVGQLLPAIADQDRRDRLSAEIEVMEAGRDYQAGDFESALTKSRRALERISWESEWVWAYATKVLAVTLQMVGDAAGAFATIDDALESGQPVSEMVRGHLLTSRCFLHWIAADRAGLERTGRAILACRWQRELPETVAMGRYFLGTALYQAGNLGKAASFLEPVATDPASPNIANQLRAVYALASVRFAGGEGESARRLLDAAGERLHQIGNTTFQPEIEAFRAELDLRQGRLAEALRWAEGFEPAFATAGYSFFLPELTAVKAWLAAGSAATLARAAEGVERQVRTLESMHSTRFLIEALALRALCRQASGAREAAHADLGRALELAQPGGYVRLFVDLGACIAPLLHAVEVDPEKARYVGRILAAFLEASAAPPLIEPLTAREIEILELVAHRLSNREIGARLHIAPGTVKRHTHGIYGKLGVHDRWSAVDKARGLGVLA